MSALRVWFIATVALASGAACGAFGSDDSSDDHSETDGGPTSTSDAAPSTDGGGTSPGTVLADDFEADVLGGCGSRWQSAAGAFMTRVPQGRDGGWACQICRPTSTGDYKGMIASNIPAPSIDHYAEAWVRNESPTDGAVPSGMLQVGYDVPDAARVFKQSYGSIGPTWTPLQLNVVPGTKVSLGVYFATMTPGLCILVDDVVLRH